MRSFLRENIMIALHTAIEERSKYEREQLKYTRDSGLVAGWRDAMEIIENGGQINLID